MLLALGYGDERYPACPRNNSSFREGNREENKQKCKIQIIIKHNAGAMTVECTGYEKHCEGVTDVVGGQAYKFLGGVVT